MIQQAIAQQAIRKVKEYVEQGYSYAVEVDQSKYLGFAIGKNGKGVYIRAHRQSQLRSIPMEKDMSIMLVAILTMTRWIGLSPGLLKARDLSLYLS